jgi:hypothetical protein
MDSPWGMAEQGTACYGMERHGTTWIGKGWHGTAETSIGRGASNCMALHGTAWAALPIPSHSVASTLPQNLSSLKFVPSSSLTLRSKLPPTILPPAAESGHGRGNRTARLTAAQNIGSGKRQEWRARGAWRSMALRGGPLPLPSHSIPSTPPHNLSSPKFTHSSRLRRRSKFPPTVPTRTAESSTAREGKASEGGTAGSAGEQHRTLGAGRGRNGQPVGNWTAWNCMLWHGAACGGLGGHGTAWDGPDLQETWIMEHHGVARSCMAQHFPFRRIRSHFTLPHNLGSPKFIQSPRLRRPAKFPPTIPTRTAESSKGREGKGREGKGKGNGRERRRAAWEHSGGRTGQE